MENYGPTSSATNKEYSHALLKRVAVLLEIKHFLRCLIMTLSLIVFIYQIQLLS